MSTVNNEKLNKRDLLIVAEVLRRLAATTAGKGASLIGIQDAGNLITATTVEGALAEIAAVTDGGAVIQKRELRVQHGDPGFPAGDANGTADVINLGAVLPANAIVLATEVNIATLFSGGGLTAVKLDVGGTDAQGIVKQQDVFTGATSGATALRTGNLPVGKYSGQQLVLTFTPDAGHKMSAATAGDLTVDVWYSVLA